MVTRREQYRYDKWLDSLKDSDYNLMGKVVEDAMKKNEHTAYSNGIVAGSMIVAVVVLVMALVIVVI